MSREGENIYQRKDGRYEGRYMVSKDKNEKTKYVSVYGYSREEVREKLLTKKEEQNQSYLWRNKPFEEVADVWLSRCREKLSALTCDKYEFWYERYVLPEFRGTVIRDISLERIKQLPKVILDKELKNGNQLKQSTLLQIGTIVAGVCQLAKEMDCPDKDNTNQNVKSTQGQNVVLTVAEQEKLCICAKYNHCQEMLASLLILYCGVGTGEVCALHCDDIYLERREMYIHQTVQRVKRKNTEDTESKTERMVVELPTKKQIRTVHIPEVLMDYINEFYHKGVYLLGGKQEIPFEVRTLQNRTGKLLKLYHLDVNFIRMHNTFIKGKADIEILKNVFGVAIPAKLNEDILNMDQLKKEMIVDLPALRLLVGLTIEEISSYIGISDDLYRKIELGLANLSWVQFLALLFLFQYNRKTEVILEPLGLFPSELEKKIKI